MGTGSSSGPRPREGRVVLFVCVENAARSLMAESIFNSCAPAGWQARSAGTRPASLPNPRTGPALKEMGLELPPHSPQLLTPELVREAEMVVTMGCLDEASCPAFLTSLGPVRDWGLPDPSRMDPEGFRSVRDEIVRRVGSLCTELTSTHAVEG